MLNAPRGDEQARHNEANLARFDLKEYARRGAQARVAELNTELAGIYQAFPDMRRRRAAVNSSTAGSQMPSSSRARRRSNMSPAQRRAVSARMKKYWSERRKAQAK
jgi:hypothetical protein